MSSKVKRREIKLLQHQQRSERHMMIGGVDVVVNHQNIKKLLHRLASLLEGKLLHNAQLG